MNWDIKLCGPGMRSGPGSRWERDEYDQNTVYEVLNGLIEIFFFSNQRGDRKRKGDRKLIRDKFYNRGDFQTRVQYMANSGSKT